MSSGGTWTNHLGIDSNMRGKGPGLPTGKGTNDKTEPSAAETEAVDKAALQEKLDDDMRARVEVAIANMEPTTVSEQETAEYLSSGYIAPVMIGTDKENTEPGPLRRIEVKFEGYQYYEYLPYTTTLPAFDLTKMLLSRYGNRVSLPRGLDGYYKCHGKSVNVFSTDNIIPDNMNGYQYVTVNLILRGRGGVGNADDEGIGHADLFGRSDVEEDSPAEVVSSQRNDEMEAASASGAGPSSEPVPEVAPVDPAPVNSDTRSGKRRVVYCEPVLKSNSNITPRTEYMSNQEYNKLEIESQNKLIKNLSKIRKNAHENGTQPWRPTSDNNNLRPHQRHSVPQIKLIMKDAVDDLICYIQYNPHHADEEGLFRRFGKWRWMLNEAVCRSGKSVTVSAECFFSPWDEWHAHLKKLPEWAFKAMFVMPRRLYLTVEKDHKTEITKESLNKAIFGTLGKARAFKDTSIVMRDDGLAILPEHVAPFASKNYELVSGQALDINQYADSHEVTSTVQRFVREIRKGHSRIGDFFFITKEELHLHKMPGQRPEIDKDDWSLIDHTFRSSFIVGVSGTMPDWATNGFRPWYAPDSLIIPRAIATCTIGDLFLEGVVCRTNFVSMRIQKVARLSNGEYLDLDGPLMLPQKDMVRYSPDIWCLFAAFNFTFLCKRIDKRGFILQGVIFTPSGRGEERCEGGELSVEDKSRDKDLPFKMFSCINQRVLKSNPNEFLNSAKGNKQLVLDYCMSSEQSQSDKKIKAFKTDMTIDVMISENILRNGLDRETIETTMDFKEHKHGVTSAMGEQKQSEMRSSVAITGNAITRAACRREGCEKALDDFCLEHNTPGPDGKKKIQDCFNFNLAINSDNLMNAREYSVKSNATHFTTFSTDVLTTNASQVVTLVEDEKEPSESSGSGDTGSSSDAAGPVLIAESTPSRNSRSKSTASRTITGEQREEIQKKGAEKAKAAVAYAAQSEAKALMEKEKEAHEILKKIERDKRAANRNKAPLERFVAAASTVAPAIVNKEVRIVLTHPFAVAVEEGKVEYTLWGSECSLAIDGSSIPEDQWTIIPSEISISSHKVEASGKYNELINTVRVCAEVTSGESKRRYYAAETPITDDFEKEIVLKTKELAKPRKASKWKPLNLTPARIGVLQRGFDKIFSRSDVPVDMVSVIFIHCVCKSGHKQTKEKGSMLDEPEVLPGFADLVNSTRAEMGKNNTFYEYFLKEGALENSFNDAVTSEAAEHVQWPTIPRAKTMHDLVGDDYKAKYVANSDSVWPISCTIEGFYAAAGNSVHEKIAHMTGAYASKMGDECVSSEDDNIELMKEDDESEVPPSSTAVSVPGPSSLVPRTQGVVVSGFSTARRGPSSRGSSSRGLPNRSASSAAGDRYDLSSFSHAATAFTGPVANYDDSESRKPEPRSGRGTLRAATKTSAVDDDDSMGVDVTVGGLSGDSSSSASESDSTATEDDEDYVDEEKTSKKRSHSTGSGTARTASAGVASEASASAPAQDAPDPADASAAKPKKRRLLKPIDRIHSVEEAGSVAVQNDQAVAYVASPQDCFIAQSIKNNPLLTTTFQMQQRENGSTYLPVQGRESKSLRQGPAPEPDPNAPVPVNAVQPVGASSSSHGTSFAMEEDAGLAVQGSVLERERRGTADTVDDKAREEMHEKYPTLLSIFEDYKRGLIDGVYDDATTPEKADSRVKRVYRFVWLNMKAAEKYPSKWPLPEGDALSLMMSRVEQFKTGGTFEEFAFTHPVDEVSNYLPWAQKPKENDKANHSACQDQHRAVKALLSVIMSSR